MLGDVGQDQIGRDRRDLVEPRLAELPLDVVLLGEPEAAIGLHRHICRLPGRVRRQQFGHVGFSAARLAAIEQIRRANPHQVGRLDVHVRPRDRELHPLVLTDRPAEHLAVAGITRRALDEPAAVADALGGNQDALRIEPIDQYRKPFPSSPTSASAGTSRSSKNSSVVA